MWRSAVVRAAPLIARRYHASAITRKATAVSATAVVKTENRQKYQPLFEDPFAKEKLQRSTIYAISDNRTYGTMRFYGYHAMEAFEKLTGVKLSPESAGKPAVSQLRTTLSNTTAIAFFNPIESGPSLHDTLEVYFDPKIREQVVAIATRLGPDFIAADDQTFIERSMTAAQPSASFFPEVKYLLDSASEEQRRETMRKNGLGLSVLYQAWNEAVGKCGQMLSAQILDGSDETRNVVGDIVREQVQTIMKGIQQHLSDDRRVADLQKGINISIVGPPNAGKSTFLNLLSQKYVCKVDDEPGSTTDINDQRLNIDQVPVAITDTVGLSTTTTDITNGLKRTFQRMDSSDLKICMLDMKQIYDDKSPASIDPSVMEAIDSDTIVLINKRDLVNIRIPAAPGKIRYKNSPLGPQGEIKRTAFRGKIPLRLDGDTSGNSIQHGDYGLRVLEDVRLTEACLQECRSTLHRHIKNIRGARFWLRVVPDHPVSSKPVGVRMGKGKGAFDHWEAKVPNKKIVFEIGGGVREEAARDIMRIVGTRVPGKTEFVVAEKEETIEEMSRRVREFSKVPPLGVWCISCETGEGIEDFLGELSQIIRDRYQLQCDSQEFALSEPVSLRMKCLQQCADQLSAMLSSKEALNGESLSIVSQSIQNVVQNSSVRDAVNFMFHSKYGVLHKNQMQCQQ